MRPKRRRWPAQLKTPAALKKTMALTILFEGNAEERLNWLEGKKAVRAASSNVEAISSRASCKNT